MGKYWPVAVEVIAFLTFFATSMLDIITQKYIYHAAAEEHANTNKHYFCKTSQNTECCNSTDIGINMQRSTYTEYWLLYINLASLLVAIPSTVLLGIWSETDGRKVVLTVSLLGTVLRVALFITILKFQESFYFFVIASLITSTLGYNTSLMASSMTFIADITSSGQRTLRIVFLDCAKGFGIGLAYFISGFYFERDWFQHFLWLVLAVSIFNIMYVAFFLEETILTNEAAPICSCNYFVAVYRLFSFHPGNGRRWRLLTFAIALFIVGIVTTGTNNLLILYAQTSLCFTLVWTGYLYGALTLRFIPSLVGVKLLQSITNISNNWLIEAGLLSFLAGLILAAFSNTTRLFFNDSYDLPDEYGNLLHDSNGRDWNFWGEWFYKTPEGVLSLRKKLFHRGVPAFQFLGAMPLAVIKGSMSRLVEPQEQGTLFAVVSCLESSACFLGVFIFRHLYQPTSDVFPGFSFVIGAFLLIIPAVLVGIIHRNEDPTRNLFYQDESSETDFGRQCSISTRSTSKQRIFGVPVVTNGDLISYQEYSIVTNEDQGISF